MAQVYRDNKFNQLTERLTNKKTNFCGENIFTFKYDLMIFSAMIGFYYGENTTVNDKGNEIKQDTFENNNLDVYVYLCALQDKKSGEIFREKNDNECWKIFESYANSGLGIIDNWLLDSPGDIDGVDTILNEMKKVAAEMLATEEVAPNLGDLEF